jgi:hypothetical protein
MAGSIGNTVVLRFRDGHAIHAALTNEFTPRDSVIEAETDDGEHLRIKINELKAVFFLKDERRRAASMQFGDDEVEQPIGASARVEFFDGEIVHGRVQEYTVENTGFFLYPSSAESNNEKIFVVAQSLQTLSLEA